MNVRTALSVTLAPLLLLPGCGGAKSKGDDAPKTVTVESPYEVACRNESAKRRAEEQHKRYLPPELLLHRWPGQKKTDKSPQVLSEEAAVELLTEGKARSTLLVARGGTGKSKLAWSLQAQACSKVPIARIDLNWDIAQKAREDAEKAAVDGAKEGGAKKGGDSALESLAAAALLGQGKGAADLQRAYEKQRWVLLLDSLDEVPLGEREKVVGQVNAAMKRYPTLHVLLLTRPPVYTGNYGLDEVQAFAELPQLDCEHTDAALAKLVGDNDERAKLKAFASKFGLLRKVKGAAERCIYPHMATYRDLNVVRKLAANHAAASKSVDIGKFASSRAQIYTFFLSVQLVRDLQTVAVLPKQALAVVDAMIGAKNPGSGDRNARFTTDDCAKAAAAEKVGDAAKTNAFCERLMQASLFVSAPAPGTFRLANQSIYDLFMARWMASQLDPDNDPACKPLAARAALFESNEIVGFLSGLEQGQRCLVPIAAQLCKQGGFAEHNFEQLDQGLPHGPARKKIVDAAQDAAEKLSEGPSDMCVSALMDRLYK